jgi:hypothetical protein
MAIFANHRRFIVRKDAQHTRQITGAVQINFEQTPNGVLIFSDAIEIAHALLLDAYAGQAKVCSEST